MTLILDTLDSQLECSERILLNGSSGMGSKAEVELVLMIVAEDPAAIADRAAGLTSVGNFAFKPAGQKRIHDVYFDTIDGRLRRKLVNLRVREVDREFFVTLKRNPGRFSWHSDERQEMELPWSEKSVTTILAQLKKDAGLREGLRFDNSRPVDMLVRAGLVVLQDRTTDRRIRNVSSIDGPPEILAELAIDQVVYHFKQGDTTLFEFELEAKSREGRRVLPVLGKILAQTLGPAVRPWRWGKLATGRKIEKLLDQGVLTGFVDAGLLRPAAYNLILQAMKT